MSGQTRRKQYVEVNADHDIDGNIVPRLISFTDGTAFKVKEVRKVAKVATLSALPTTSRYTIVIGEKETFLYEDGGKWYVHMKT